MVTPNISVHLGSSRATTGVDSSELAASRWKKGRSSHLNFSVQSARWEFRYHRLPMSSKRG